jgi:predicted peptidase
MISPLFTGMTAKLVLVAVLVTGGYYLITAIEQRGWDRRDALAQVQAAAVEKANSEERLTNLIDGQARDALLEIQLEALRTASATRATQLSTHLKAQTAAPYQPKKANCDRSDQSTAIPDAQAAPDFDDRPLLDQSVLDAVTLGLLNDARANRARPAPDIAPTSGDAGRTAPAAD